jgi:hypothetical protein
MKISRHSQLQPLKEIWLGDTYPESFYSQFDQQAQDVFGHITETTRRDLAKIERKLQELGVTVQRPKFEASVDLYLDDHNNLTRPPISPCDFALVLDDVLYITPQYVRGIEPFQAAIDSYLHNQQKVVVLDRSLNEDMCYVVFPSVCFLGKDIYIDYNSQDPVAARANWSVANLLASQGYRVHLSKTNDHSDGVFCPLKPGAILSSHYRSSYHNSFPQWQIHHLSQPGDFESRPAQQKWWLPGYDHAVFNPTIIDVAKSWLGSPHETVFEVNLIVVDEHNVICERQADTTLKWFESIGITPHVIDFEAGTFWDAGLHCLTADICREGPVPEYWPDRSAPGVFEITEW